MGRSADHRKGYAMSVVRRLVRLFACIILVATALFPIGAARADTSGGTRVCEGPYALCSSAQCQPIDGDTRHVTCACEGPLNGLNIGNYSCLKRTEALTSTFSLWDLTPTGNKPAKKSVSCSGENSGKWAFCLDAPCNVENGRVSCKCKLHRAASAFIAFVDQCPADGAALHSICAQIWSSATSKELQSGYSQLAKFYGAPSEIALCPIVKPKN